MKDEAFYLRPKSSKGYANVPLGQHTIQSYLKNIFIDGGFKGNFTLHSLRRTGATRLFQNDTPEGIIKTVGIIFICSVKFGFWRHFPCI